MSVVHEQTSQQKAQTLHRQPPGTLHLHDSWANKMPTISGRLILFVLILLQWTPKDDFAVLKLHGKCDDVMSLLMEELNIQIPAYDR